MVGQFVLKCGGNDIGFRKYHARGHGNHHIDIGGFVANLGPYARQTSIPVRADIFAEVAQIIVQLAVAIDLATVIPGPLHQLGLTLIFQ